jgi:uncharacterized RDD family membrane protein YckC
VQSSDQLHIHTPEQIALELPLAGIGSRFLGLAIDTLLQILLYIVGGLLLAWIGTSAIDRVFVWLPPSWFGAVAILFIFCVYWGYFAIFEIFWNGQTPGKRLAKIRVIKESGRPINAYEAIARNLMRAIDALPAMYGAGIVCMMLNTQNRRIGDFVAGTVVVHDQQTEEVRPDWNTAAESAPANPRLALLTADDLLLIETYLQRRFQLDQSVRESAALQIGVRITNKTGLPCDPNRSMDDFLESVARQIRDTARFR